MEMKSDLSYESLKERLPDILDIDIEVYDTVCSTNTVAAQRISEGCRQWHTVVALSQTGGQGRLGRSFFSPSGTGLYMSTVLFPGVEKIGLITGAAAVAVCEALEEYGISPKIKWVNDIIVEKKKVCGILAKGIHTEKGSAVILGIGINVYPPEAGFPQDISDIAGYLFKERKNDLIGDLFVKIIERLKARIEKAGYDNAPEEYRKRCLTVGRAVRVIPAGKPECCREAMALFVDDNFHITVKYENGDEETLSSGEVSVKL